MIVAALVGVGVVWAAVVVVVAGVCASAAAGDQTLPRRSTCRTVRSRSFRSSHSDQLAT